MHSKIGTHSGDEAFRPLSVFRLWVGAEFTLSHQLPLSSCGGLHKSTSSTGNVLSSLKNLLFKVEVLISRLMMGREREKERERCQFIIIISL